MFFLFTDNLFVTTPSQNSLAGGLLFILGIIRIFA